jgi:hypothetical protein
MASFLLAHTKDQTLELLMFLIASHRENDVPEAAYPGAGASNLGVSRNLLGSATWRAGWADRRHSRTNEALDDDYHVHRRIETATRERCPVIGLWPSGGAKARRGHGGHERPAPGHGAPDRSRHGNIPL